jgi:hypothetical protein
MGTISYSFCIISLPSIARDPQTSTLQEVLGLCAAGVNYEKSRGYANNQEVPVAMRLPLCDLASRALIQNLSPFWTGEALGAAAQNEPRNAAREDVLTWAHICGGRYAD